MSQLPSSRSAFGNRRPPPVETATALVSRGLTFAVRSASWGIRRTPVLRGLAGPVRSVLGRLDLTDLVLAVVDLDRIAARLDLEAILARVDVDAVVARADLDRVIDRLDLINLARYVVDGIDLPDLVRESTGSVTSDMVRDVRTQSAAADHQLERAIDRLLLRRHDRATSARPAGDGHGPGAGSSSGDDDTG